MRSQSPVLTKTSCSLSLSNSNIKESNRSTTPIILASTSSSKLINQQKPKHIQITNNNNSHSPTSIIIQQNPSTSSSTRIRNLSYHNNNSTTTINNNSKLSTSIHNNNNDETNPNKLKLESLEQRKLELEKLLNEKNWFLQQIYKQEAQILNGNYENCNFFEIAKLTASGGACASSSNNSMIRLKGSSSLKLPKTNLNFNAKSNRFTLSKSEYDLAQEANKQGAATSSNVGLKKRQGPPQKTNSFHDSTSAASAFSLNKSPSFEYNGGGDGSSSGGTIKYGIARLPTQQHTGSNSNENLSNNFGITQCDKYYLSPTSQMYTDGNGFIKASQNIKQCLASPSSPMPSKMMVPMNTTVIESQPNLEQYESIDTLSLSPSSNTCDQQQQHANFWRAISNSDRCGWSDNSYIELDSERVSQFDTLKTLAKKNQPSGSSLNHHSVECTTLGNFYPVAGGGQSMSNEKSCDELSISSVNSETSKKPKNKQWMESSLDGPIIRPNILQITPLVTEAISLYPAMSPTLSPLNKTPLEYAYYNVAAPATTAISIGKLTSTASVSTANGMLLVPAVNSRPTTRNLLLNHHAHSSQQQTHVSLHRERQKLSSQSMSSGSYRTPKTKLDDETSQLSHSTSFLNYDPYHHHFQQQQQQQQMYQQSHYHVELPFQHQKQQKSPKTHHHQQQQQQQQQQQLTPALQPKFSQTINSGTPTSSSLYNANDAFRTTRYDVTSVAPSPPSNNCNSNQAPAKKPIASSSLSSNNILPQMSPIAAAATSPDIRIESPKNMTVVQQATFLPYKEVTKPFEMSDFYKYSTKFRQKDVNSATISKN